MTDISHEIIPPLDNAVLFHIVKQSMSDPITTVNLIKACGYSMVKTAYEMGLLKLINYYRYKYIKFTVEFIIKDNEHHDDILNEIYLIFGKNSNSSLRIEQTPTYSNVVKQINCFKQYKLTMEQQPDDELVYWGCWTLVKFVNKNQIEVIDNTITLEIPNALKKEVLSNPDCINILYTQNGTKVVVTKTTDSVFHVDLHHFETKSRQFATMRWQKQYDARNKKTIKS